VTIAGGAHFPRRELIIQLTFVAILATVVLQSLTLPGLIRMLKLHQDGDDSYEEWEARLRVARAALEQIGRLEAASDGDTDVADALRRLRARYEQRISRLEPLGAPDGDECRFALAHQVELFRQVLSTERSTIVDLRNKGTVSDEVLRRVLRDLDLEELHFQSVVD
jgi:monovalent cation/hydrogen antiporter